MSRGDRKEMAHSQAGAKRGAMTAREHAMTGAGQAEPRGHASGGRFAVPSPAFSRRHLLRGSGGVVALALAARVVPDRYSLAAIPRAPLTQPGDAITLGMRGEPRSLDPAFAYDFVANPVVCQISEGLLRLDAFGRLQPLLAKSWTVSNDRLTYVYQLREGVRFHGDEDATLTAADVVASLERVRDPALGSPLRWMVEPIASVAATGDLEVTVRLSAPWSLFQYVPATAAGHVLPAAFLAGDPELINRAPIGTGPFQLAEWAPGQHVRLTRHEDYWMPDRPHLAEATFRFIPDPLTRRDALGDDLHGLVPDALTPEEHAALVANDAIGLLEMGGNSAVFVAFRCDQEPFGDEVIRRGIAQAVDIDTIFTRSVGPTGMCAANAIVPVNVYAPCSNAGLFDPVPYDPDAAREAIGQLAPNGLSAVLNVLDEDPWRGLGREIAEGINATLGEVGVSISLRLLPYADYVQRERNGDYEGMLLASWAADFPDASASLRPLFHSGGPPSGRNLFSYADFAVDRLLDEALGGPPAEEEPGDTDEPAAGEEATPVAGGTAADPDAARRCAAVLEAQRRIAADQPYVLIDHFGWFMPLRSDLAGYELSPQWFWDAFLRDLRFAGEPNDGNGVEVLTSETIPLDCFDFLQDQIAWMTSGGNPSLALSAISLDASGRIDVVTGTLDTVVVQSADGATFAPADTFGDDDVVRITGHATWLSDPETRTDWDGNEVDLQLTRSALSARRVTLELIPPPRLAPPLSLQPLRCQTGTLLGLGRRLNGGAGEGAVYMLNFLKRGNIVE
jgi:peptide/nickel transport system substrate-binding protein